MEIPRTGREECMEKRKASDVKKIVMEEHTEEKVELLVQKSMDEVREDVEEPREEVYDVLEEPKEEKVELQVPEDMSCVDEDITTLNSNGDKKKTSH
ncbi:unnamed protein product [Lactuca saligna]|uniref:Uncharacterized protein n=1 Tax=Lactuca saligna TaxID=75948 RepID=A0AA35Y976_LACSI|nr:unnamed protein product [Lactuca saligna]